MFKNEIMNDPENIKFTKNNIESIYKFTKNALILFIGQAPGYQTQVNKEVFRDRSGQKLRNWLGVSEDVFYSNKIAVLPMDFYFPGKGKTGDLPPRKDFASKWHPKLIKEMPKIKLIILLGSYAINYYLNEKNVTTAVKNYQTYLPKYFPLIHPSPLNQRWISKNEWFKDVLIDLKIIVNKILK